MPEDSRTTDAVSPDPPLTTAWWSRPERDDPWGAPDAAAAVTTEGEYGGAQLSASAPVRGDAADYGTPTVSEVQYGQPTPYGEATTYGQPPAYGQAPAFGQAPGYGQTPVYPQASSYGGTSSYGQPSSYGTAPGYGQSGATPARPDFAFGSPWGPVTDTLGRPEQDGPARGRGRLAAVAGAILATALISGITGGLIGSQAGRGDGLLDPSASLGTGGTAPSVDRAPESVAGIAARVLRSTVTVEVRVGSTGGNGSGVVIREDGYVLTNNHVVAMAADRPDARLTVTVDGKGNEELPATIVGRDPDTDLAVLKITAGGPFIPASLGQSRGLVAGDPVIAIGSPLGYAGTVTTGIVSGLNRTVRVPGENGQDKPLFNAIQTDASINPGNSGGALVDGRGQVIGINTAIATPSGGGQGGSVGVGFAVPIDEGRSVAEEIIRTGRATHPVIGVEAVTVTGQSGAGGQAGAQVQALVEGGAAQAAGLQSGDLIVKVGDETVTSVDELIVEIRQHRIGERVPVTYERGGQTKTTTLVLREKPPTS